MEEKVHIAAGSICDAYRVTVGGELCALKEYSLFRLKKLKIHGYRGCRRGYTLLKMKLLYCRLYHKDHLKQQQFDVMTEM